MFAYINWRKRILMWAYTIFAGFFFVGAIGLFEGAYNHVLKNILYFGGFSLDTLHKMYPLPKYQLLNDWIFEILGVMTLFVSLWCLKTMIDWMKGIDSVN